MEYLDSSQGTAIRVAERRRLVFSLRKQGLSYQEIADQVKEIMGEKELPSSWSSWYAHQDVQWILDKMRDEVAESAADVIALENARLDTMLSSLWPKVLKGDTGSVNTVLKIMERRAKMFGLDEATKVDWKVEIGGLLAAGLLTREEVRLELGDELYNTVSRYLAEEAEGDIGGEDILATKMRTTTTGQEISARKELEAPATQVIDGELND